MNTSYLSRLSGFVILAKLALFVTGLCALSLSHASVILIQDSFESYTLGNTPGNPGDGNPNNWVISGYDTDAVVAGSSVGGMAPNQQLLHLESDGSGDHTLYRQFTRQDGSLTADHSLTLSFKMKPGQIAGSAYSFRLIDSGVSGANNPMAISVLSNGRVNVFSSNTGPGAGGITQVTVPTITLQEDKWYEFVLHGDMNTQRYSLSITDLATSATYSTGSLYFLRNIQAVDRLVFMNTTEANRELDWQLDDIQLLSSIPEPQTTAGVAALLLLGATCLLRRKKGKS